MSNRHARNENYLDDLHSEVHRYATLSARSDGFHVFVPCTHPGCGPVEAFFMRAKIPTKQIANYMHRKGWTFDGNKRATCPDHQSIRKEFPVKTADLNSTVATAALTSTTEASQKAKIARRETVLLLDDIFDTEKGCYRSGENDETVGDAVKLSAAAVAAIREEFGYIIKRPAELDGLLVAMKAAEENVATVRAESIEKIDGLSKEIIELRRKIENVASKYR